MLDFECEVYVQMLHSVNMSFWEYNINIEFTIALYCIIHKLFCSIKWLSKVQKRDEWKIYLLIQDESELKDVVNKNASQKSEWHEDEEWHWEDYSLFIYCLNQTT